MTSSPVWKRISSQGDIPEGRSGHSATLKDDQLYIFGGNIGTKASSDIYSFSLTSKTWKKLNTSGTKPPARYNHSAVLDKHGSLVIFGGCMSLVKRNDLFIFDFNTLSWTNLSKKTKGTPPEKRHSHSAITGPGNSADWMLIFGGTTGTHQNDVHQLHFATLQWKKIDAKGDIPSARYGHSACVYGSEMFVFGGHDGMRTSGKDGYLNTLHSLDLSRFIWRLVKLEPGI